LTLQLHPYFGFGKQFAKLQVRCLANQLENALDFHRVVSPLACPSSEWNILAAQLLEKQHFSVTQKTVQVAKNHANKKAHMNNEKQGKHRM
jgi:hypothetical protein